MLPPSCSHASEENPRRLRREGPGNVISLLERFLTPYHPPVRSLVERFHDVSREKSDAVIKESQPAPRKASLPDRGGQRLYGSVARCLSVVAFGCTALGGNQEVEFGAELLSTDPPPPGKDLPCASNIHSGFQFDDCSSWPIHCGRRRRESWLSRRSNVQAPLNNLFSPASNSRLTRAVTGRFNDRRTAGAP